jgi:hypothetical protein
LQNNNVSAETAFNPNGTGAEVWQSLQGIGALKKDPEVYRPSNLILFIFMQ